MAKKKADDGGAILQLSAQVRELDVLIRDFVTRTSGTFGRMQVTLSHMLDEQGTLHGRLDDHEARLVALERKKG